jgi:putative hydroxymethylpyrimidine transporter CytX
MNKIKNTSMFLLWAGAAISLSEIYTGGMLAPLGFTKGLLAIVLGHVIGTALLAFGGYISFTGSKNAMEVVRSSMGGAGAKATAFLNVLQLVGWSAIMIIQGGRALHFIFPVISYNLAVLVMSLIVLAWAYSFNTHTKLMNDASVVLLIILCVLLFWKIDFRNLPGLEGNMSFITAVELSIAMPISWLPLIGDYTKNAQSKSGAYRYSFVGYFLASVLMYTLGLLITLHTGKDIIEYIATSYVKWLACIVIVLSTATTTFLDIYSAVTSSRQFLTIRKENVGILLCSILAAGVAYVFPIEAYQNFLLAIGSVFVPIYTVVFLDYLLKRKRAADSLNIPGMVAALAGIAGYHLFSRWQLGLPTVFAMLIVAGVYLSAAKIFKSGGMQND